MKRKTYRLKPELFLLIGPDSYHQARLGPVSVGELLDLLRRTPKEIHDASWGGTEGAKRNGELLSAAIHDWNSTFAEEEGESAWVDGWRWLGIAVGAKGGGVDVWVSAMGDEYDDCTVLLDEDLLASEARTAALKAYEALSVVVAPRRDGR